MRSFAPINPVPTGLAEMRQRWADRAHQMALILMDEDHIIKAGESMEIQTDEPEPLHIYFERLESEPQPIDASVLFLATLMVSHTIRR